MLSLHERDTLAIERRHDLLREADQRRLTQALPGPSFRASAAAALIAFALWLAPAVTTSAQPTILAHH